MDDDIRHETDDGTLQRWTRQGRDEWRCEEWDPDDDSDDRHSIRTDIDAADVPDVVLTEYVVHLMSERREVKKRLRSLGREMDELCQRRAEIDVAVEHCTSKQG